MAESFDIKDIVLFLDNYSADSRNLHASFKALGYSFPAVVIEEDGFLPEDVMSVYGFFLGDFQNHPKVLGKPRYFNQIVVPEYWEITANSKNGKISNLSKERGRIFYAEPAHKRLVKVVDWLDEKGIVRSSDHYNKFGALFARTVFNEKGQKVNKSFFDADGREIIVENYVTGDIILNEKDETYIFHKKVDFIIHFFMRADLKQSRLFFNSLSTPLFVSQRLETKNGNKRDVLFWQEPIHKEIPGNMKLILDGQAKRASRIVVQKRDAYQKLMKLGANESLIHPLGFIYPFTKDNRHSAEALICTNSDRVEQCSRMIQELPNMHFHIAALTEMSAKLMSLDSYENVTLYPGVKLGMLDELFDKCDFYFDVNHESEIVSAVSRAFLSNQLIFAFRETLHNADYVPEEQIYEIKDTDRMLADVKAALEDDSVIDNRLKVQQEHAMAETIQKYENVLNSL